MHPTIVFVHLNSPIPLHLKLNINSTIKKFPKVRVVLIHNLENLKKIDRQLVQFKYVPGVTSKLIENSLSHPRDFRSNFWFSAIQRFDALSSYLEQFNESILHLESDVIISGDFPIERFTLAAAKIAFPIVANNRGVASSVFIKDFETSKKLVGLAKELSLINPHTTDMEILAEFNKRNQDITMPLAFGPESSFAYHGEFQIGRLAQSIQVFAGVFDGNDIGMFLFGTDPRNARGTSFLRTSISGNYAKVGTWNFIFDKSRRFINLEFNGQTVPVYSVHATSKRLSLFHHATQSLILQRQLQKKHREGSVRIFPFISLTMAIRKVVKLVKR